MKRVCPGSLQYAVVCIDPVAMVSHFNDRAASEEAQAMRPQKYLVYLDHALDLPFSTTEWFRFQVSPIGATLPPADPSRGITPDMSIPIYPNEQHPTGRTPIRTLSPFPFSNCYHWADSALTVRVRRNPDKYDDSAAVKITSSEHVRMMKLLGEDCRRIDECVEAREAELPVAPRAPRPSSPSSLDSRLSANSGDADMDFAGANETRTPDEDDDDDSLEDDHDPRPNQSVAGLLQMDIFSLSHDDGEEEEILPLVNLWFELEEHLSEAKIPSPLDLRRELDAVARIVRAARERHPDIRPPRRNGALDVDSEGSVSGDELTDDEDCGVYMDGVDDDDDDDDMWVTEDEEGDAHASAPAPAPVPVSVSVSVPVPVPAAAHFKPIPTPKYRMSRYAVRPACSPPSESPLSTSPNTGRRVVEF